MESAPVSKYVQEPKKNKGEILGEDKVETLVNDGTPSQTIHVDVPAPPTKIQGAIEIREVEKDKLEEIELTPKMKEIEEI